MNCAIYRTRIGERLVLFKKETACSNFRCIVDFVMFERVARLES